MAKFNKGILGPVIGKIGPVIGSSWKGIPYFRAVNKNPKKRKLSEAQQQHHQKFIFLTRWLRPLHPYLTAGFRNLAVHNTQINLAFSHHYKAALKGTSAPFHIDYEQVRISMGDLDGLHEPRLSLRDGNTLELSWAYAETARAAYDDQLMLVLYNDALGRTDGFIGGVKRMAQGCIFTFEERRMGEWMHVYVGLMSLDGHHISDSQYLGKIEKR